METCLSETEIHDVLWGFSPFACHKTIFMNNYVCPEHIHVLDGIKQKYLRVNSVFLSMYEFNSMSCRILFFSI